MAVLRYYSVYSSSSEQVRGSPVLNAIDAVTTVLQLLWSVVLRSGRSMICGKPLQDVFTSTHVQDAIAYNLAGSAYLMSSKQQAQSTTVRPLPQSAEAAAAGNTVESPARQLKAQKQIQKPEVAAGESAEQLQQLFSLLRMASPVPPDRSTLRMYKEYTEYWGGAAEVIAAVAASNLMEVLKVILRLPALGPQLGSNRRSDQQVMLYRVVLQVLMQLMLLVHEENALHAVNVCFVMLAYTAKSVYHTVEELPADEATVAVAAARNVLAPLILQGVPLMPHALDHNVCQDERKYLEELWVAALSGLMIQGTVLVRVGYVWAPPFM